MDLNYSDIINADTLQEPVRVFPTLKVIWENHSFMQKSLGKKLMTDSRFNHSTKIQNM